MSISAVLIYVVILIALGLAGTVAFSAADKYGLLDRVKKSRATRRVRRHARRVLFHAASRTRSAKSLGRRSAARLRCRQTRATGGVPMRGFAGLPSTSRKGPHKAPPLPAALVGRLPGRAARHSNGR